MNGLQKVTGYTITCSVEEMDLSVIHPFIADSYWAKGIPFETLKRAIENSLCFAILTESGNLVGFARMITDSATYAYLAEVFVLTEHRGKGLSKWLMHDIMSHPQLRGLRRITLATGDAHGLYQQFGFIPLSKPETFMELWKPNVYQVDDQKTTTKKTTTKV